MKKKRILFIIWSFTYGGGAERMLATLVNNLPKDKYEIDILEYWHANINNEKVDSNIHILKPIVDSLKDNKIKRIIKYILLHTFPSILRKKYIKNNYDIEISYNYLIPTFLLGKKGKTISWVHGDIYDLKEHKYNYIKQKKAFKSVNKIVAISENTYKSIIDVYPQYKNKTMIINNGYDFDTMFSKSKEFELEKSDIKKILFIGRLDENKNPLFLIEVAKLLKEDNIKFKMLFLGKGYLKDKIESKIKEYNLFDEVNLLGFQSNPYPYILNSDIIVGSSKSEGFPTVYVEGLRFGKPFVSTIVGGTEELSNSGKCGFVTNNLNEYKDYLKKLIIDNELYNKMSSEAFNYSQKFSCKNQVDIVDNLIMEILGDINES